MPGLDGDPRVSAQEDVLGVSVVIVVSIGGKNGAEGVHARGTGRDRYTTFVRCSDPWGCNQADLLEAPRVKQVWPLRIVLKALEIVEWVYTNAKATGEMSPDGVKRIPRRLGEELHAGVNDEEVGSGVHDLGGDLIELTLKRREADGTRGAR